MQQQGTVVLADAQTARIALRLDDGSHVLAERLDLQPLSVGARLSGEMTAVGTETLIDIGSATEYCVNILAYGLSFEAAEQEVH